MNNNVGPLPEPGASDRESHAVASNEQSSGPDQAQVDSTPADIRRAAMNLLARREHSLHELQHKLARRFPEPHLVAVQLQRLAAENLQSDVRFAESFARQRAMRGYGPVRVRLEMRERGLADAAIVAALDAAELDWWALAEQVLVKKFGIATPADLKEKARRIRFMQYRGFQQEHYGDLVDD